MRFRIEATYCDGHIELIEEYPCLHNFNYEVETRSKTIVSWVRDENGNRIKQERPGGVEYIPFITINSLEDLNLLCNAVANPLVYGNRFSDEPTIEIYDGYRE